jgi:ribonuclease HI
VILAAADGSSLANPGPSGWAWYIDDAHWAAGGWPKGTNNMGELMSVLDLLRATKGTDEGLRILCDSQYVINCCTRWIPGWKKRGWRKADNKPVLNLDLLKQLDEELAGRRVQFQWVRGHSGHPLNEKADELARAAATAYQQGTPLASGPGFSKAPLPIVTEQALSELTEPVQVASEELPLDQEPPVIALAQPDLLSLPVPLIIDRSEAALVVELTELTREFLGDEIQLDRERLGELMHPDYVAHLPGGLIRTKGSLLARPATLQGPVYLDILGADHLASDLTLLRYKLKRDSESFLGAILWQRIRGIWQVRFLQFSPMG